MNKLRKGLGRGLSSLIGETKSTNKSNNIEINKIVKNRFQPRKIFDENKLNELTNSIKERGVLQPIIVRKHHREMKNMKLLLEKDGF